MGWWNVRGTEQVIGDLPLDIVGGAASQVVAAYLDAFGRRPTLAEWQALLVTVMGAEEPEYRCFEDHVGGVDVVIRPAARP